jgi:hypothetical protein
MAQSVGQTDRKNPGKKLQGLEVGSQRPLGTLPVGSNPETSKPEAITAIQIPDGQCLFSFPAAVIKNSNQSNLREVGSTLPSLREVEAGTMEELCC